jgi:hypothetical protein
MPAPLFTGVFIRLKPVAEPYTIGFNRREFRRKRLDYDGRWIGEAEDGVSL